MKVALKIIKWILIYIILFILLVYLSLWVWNIFVDELPQEEARFGVTFSSLYAQQLGLDWRETYIAILDDLQVKRIRIPAYWPNVEPEKGKFNFDDLDFQINEAAERDVDIILAVGQKLPRWPECHIPDWAKSDDDYENVLMSYVEKTITRYSDVDAISHWQIENEPFLTGFGDCPPFDKELLDKEIALAKLLDSRPILITDSGELGDWVRARRRGDVFGTTMYRDVWFKRTIRFRYPLPPTWFEFKNIVSKVIAGPDSADDVIVIEMQAEAWGKDPIPFLTLEEQLKHMDFEAFKENIIYAKRAGFPDIYLWGVEWWYYLKTIQDIPEFWDHAKTLF